MSPELKEAIVTRHKHARKCKKAPTECLLCQVNIAFFQKLPLEELAEALADYPTRR